MLKLYNSLTKRLEQFSSIKNKEVGMYSCGPTVYKYAHIGNFRAYIFMDTIRRVLKHNGYSVKTVMNITDVGHLTDDSDSGQDKVEIAAKKENQSVYEIANKYTNSFIKDANKLNIGLSDITIPKATDHIDEMIEYIEKIIKNGFAYVIDGTVYFDVEKYNEEYTYGELSGVCLEEQLVGARVDIDDKKRNPYDFALWIKAATNHIMKWDSPWSVGYPGWHIECNAMGQKYLGKKFDIHTGGIDHIRFHHDNEISQSRARHGVNHARFWMHCEFLNMSGSKMSKSKGESLTISSLEQKGFNALDYRYFLLNASFIKSQNFSYDALEAAKVSRERLNNLINLNKEKECDINLTELDKFKQDFYEAINDNLNTALGIGIIWDMLKKLPKNKIVYGIMLEFDKVLGLSLGEMTKKQDDVPEEIVVLADKRLEARLKKDYQLSDKIRDEIIGKGFTVDDVGDGYNLKRR